jgi:hypothetical protein
MILPAAWNSLLLVSCVSVFAIAIEGLAYPGAAPHTDLKDKRKAASKAPAELLLVAWESLSAFQVRKVSLLM